MTALGTQDRLVRMYRLHSKVNRYQRAGQPAFMDTAQVWRHVATLTAEGFGESHIAAVAGCAPSAIHHRRPRMKTAIAQRILKVDRQALYATATDRTQLPAVGAIRRIRALQAIGWPLTAIGGTVARNVVHRGSPVISAANWRLIADAYSRLSMDKGPSPATRTWAAKAGYAPPLAWDDDTIDDPAAVAQGTR